MAPIVDGLKAEFGERVAFMAYNALDNARGEQAFAQSALPGHPGFLILDAAGQERYRAVGIVAAAELRAALNAVLAPQQ